MTLSINNCNEISLRVTSSRPCLLFYYWHSLNSCLSHCFAVVHTTTNCHNSGFEPRGMSHTLIHSRLKVYTERRREVLGENVSPQQQDSKVRFRSALKGKLCPKKNPCHYVEFKHSLLRHTHVCLYVLVKWETLAQKCSFKNVCGAVCCKITV